MTIPIVWLAGNVGRLCFRTFSSAPENGFNRETKRRQLVPAGPVPLHKSSGLLDFSMPPGWYDPFALLEPI